MSSRKIYEFSKMNPFVLLLIFVSIIMIIFWIAKGLLKILSFVAPFLLIAAIIVNHRVVLGYGKWIVGSVKRNPLFGIIAIVFTVIGFPIVAAFLLIRALSSKGVDPTFEFRKGEYIQYEEVNDDFLDLSELKEHKKKLDNDYNDVIK